MDSVCDVRESRAYKSSQRPSTPPPTGLLGWATGRGGAVVSQPSSETEPSETEMAKAETSKPEPYDAEPKQAKQKTANGRRRRRRHCRKDNFSSFATYFPGVLRQMHKGLSLSHDSVNILDSFVKDMFERIAEEAGRLARYNKRRTITHEDIEAAVRLLLPGELRKHAITEATKSLIRYHTCR
ncbi:late histone H2B.L4-like [Bubalus bubalis]|uniref:late histone H2B.L4-like n=1 Tax=Bubalus bubalis TaxID=89462 RepID=UPI000DBC7B82|nr:late histone H2B.L4-like [Bubalus bubalis]